MHFFCAGYNRLLATSSQSSFSGAVQHALVCIGNNDFVHVFEAVYNIAATVSYGFPLDMAKSFCYQLLPFMFDFRRGSTEPQDTYRVVLCLVNSHMLSHGFLSSENYQRRVL